MGLTVQINSPPSLPRHMIVWYSFWLPCKPTVGVGAVYRAFCLIMSATGRYGIGVLSLCHRRFLGELSVVVGNENGSPGSPAACAERLPEHPFMGMLGLHGTALLSACACDWKSCLHGNRPPSYFTRQCSMLLVSFEGLSR